MSHTPHRIRRIVIEAGLHGRERANVLQDRISAFSRGRLDSVLAESLAPLAGGNGLPVFAKVELDLGKLSFSHLEDDLAAGIARALKEWAVRAAFHHRRELLPALEGRGRMPAVPLLSAEENSSRGSVDSLMHFLEWGVLPDSALRASNHTVELELLAALDANADKVCATVRQLAQKQLVRRRIAGQFSENAVHQLVTALDPVNAPWMGHVIKLLGGLHAERRFVPLQNRAFSQLLWELALEYLSLHHWQALDAASLLRFLLRKLAARRKTSYEVLLADVALRRGWEPAQAQTKDMGAQSQVVSAILALLEKDVFGIRLIHAPCFVVRPEFQHLYTDLDVLAYWLRWRKLPAWSFASSAEEMARRIGPLLRELPAEVRPLVSQSATAAMQPQSRLHAASSTLSAAIQIERWLLYGLWPAGVSLPQNTALADWLESQGHASWHSALRRCSAPEEAAQRMASHLSSAFLLKLIGMLAGPDAQPVCHHVEILWSLGRQITHSSISSWQGQASRFALLHVLKHLSSANPGPLPVEALAHATLQALSLRYQVSYERLLHLVQRESPVPRLLREIYCNLEARLEHLAAKEELAALAPACTAPPGGAVLLLHYVKYGSLPETASTLSFHQLQILAEHLADDQLAAWARSSLSCVARDHAAAQRMAALFRSRAFVRLSSFIFLSMDFVGEIEHALSAMAEKLRLEPGRLLTAARAFLLQRAAQSTETRTEKEIISALFIHLSQYAALDPARLLQETAGSATPESRLGKALAKLLHEGRPRQEHKPGKSTTAAEDAMEHGRRQTPLSLKLEDAVAPEAPRPLLPETVSSGEETRPGPEIPGTKTDDHFRARLDALVYLLRHGEVPWWGGDLVRQPPDIWFDSLLESSSGPLLQALRTAALPVKAVDRLIEYVPQPFLARVVQKAAPDFGGLLLVYIEAGAGLAGNDGLSAIQSSRASRLHWRETLLYLLDENPSSRVPAHVLRGLCRRVSQQLGQAAENYLHSLISYANAHAAAKSGYAALAEALSQIQESAPSLPEKRQRMAKPASMQRKLDAASVGIGAAESAETSTETEQPAIKLIAGASAASEDGASEDDAKVDGAAADGAAVNGTKVDGASEDGTKEKAGLPESPAFPNVMDQAGQLEYLLRYGVLPQKLAAKGLAQFMDDLALRFKSHPEEYRHYLQTAITHDVERKRMARLLSPQALSHLWPVLLPSAHVRAVLCLEELHAAAAACAPATARESIWHTCIEELLRASSRLPGSRWDAALYLRLAAQRLLEDHSLRASAIIEHLRGRLSRQPDSIQEELRPALERLERETAVIPMERQIPATQPDEAPGPEAVLRKPSTAFPTDEPFYIGNAGVVLLWPFLARYFQNLGLMENNAFRGETERNRAVYLVQYLAAGKLEAPEHELLLNKVLCGAQPEQPLDPANPLTDAEEALSAQLLHAVIANWEKLRNTSREGLRQSFLLREGRLLRKQSDDSWSLTVSTKAYDLLLDSLPWRFSTVRLPWMQAVLHVKWR
jgi:Contractile injection system tape measure protein